MAAKKSFEPTGFFNQKLGFANPHLGFAFGFKAADAVYGILRRYDPHGESLRMRYNVVLDI